jgi:hypothetical protein
MREGTRYRSPVHHRTDVRDPDAYPPTVRWQDKSREVRGGRSVGKGTMIKDLAQCAPAHQSLPIRTSLCEC